MQNKKQEPVLSARGIGLQRGGRWLFRDLDLDLYAGEFLAIVGPSGVGKTTLLSCLCGMLKPSEGSVSFKLSGASAHKPEDIRSHFGIVFQELQLIPNADLLTNVLCGRLGRFQLPRHSTRFPEKTPTRGLPITLRTRRW